MKLYNANLSNFASKCRLAIYEKNAKVDIVPIPGGDLQSPEYLKIYPMGKTPALEIDGEIIGESEVINELLEESFPNPPLLPKGPKPAAWWSQVQKRPAVEKVLAEQQQALMERMRQQPQ